MPLPCEEMCEEPEGKNGRCPEWGRSSLYGPFSIEASDDWRIGKSDTTTPRIHIHIKCGDALTEPVGDLEVQILARLLAIASLKWYSFRPPEANFHGSNQ